MSSSVPERQKTLNSHLESEFEVAPLSGLMSGLREVLKTGTAQFEVPLLRGWGHPGCLYEAEEGGWG